MRAALSIARSGRRVSAAAGLRIIASLLSPPASSCAPGPLRSFSSTSIPESLGGLEQLISKGFGDDEARRGLALNGSPRFARVSGVTEARIGSLVRFEQGSVGVVLHLDKAAATVGLLTGLPGQSVQTGEACELLAPLAATAGLEQGGRALGLAELVAPLESEGQGGRPLFSLPPPPSVVATAPVSRQLRSGVTAVDLLQPLGRGHRVALVGPPGTGKSSLLAQLAAAQANRPGDFVVWLTAAPQAQVDAALQTLGSSLLVLRLGPTDRPALRYLAPLFALRAALDAQQKGRETLLLLDDLTDHALTCREIAADSLVPPPMLVGSLYSALFGYASCQLGRPSLTVVAAVDSRQTAGDPREAHGKLAAADAEHATVPAADVCVHFSQEARKAGILPALDLSRLPAHPAAPYQHPTLRLLATELRGRLQRRLEEHSRLGMQRELKIHVDFWEEEELKSLDALPALLHHSAPHHHAPLSPAEQLVLARAVLLFYFVGAPPTPRRVTEFQTDLLARFRMDHPVLFADLELHLAEHTHPTPPHQAQQEGQHAAPPEVWGERARQQEARARQLFELVDRALFPYRTRYDITSPPPIH